MGRHKESNKDLPPNMYKRGPSFYFSHPDGYWLRLSRDREEAMRLYEDCMASIGRTLDCTAEVMQARKLLKFKRFWPGEGVYMLLNGDEVVYVGMSISVVARVKQHWIDEGKDFDNVVSFYVHPIRARDVEVALIREFRPRLNREANPNYSGSAPDFSDKEALPS